VFWRYGRRIRDKSKTIRQLREESHSNDSSASDESRPESRDDREK